MNGDANRGELDKSAESRHSRMTDAVTAAAEGEGNCRIPAQSIANRLNW
jgi:hypothetical protein